MSKYPDFVSSTGYGTGEGLGGWNCYHRFFAFVEGSTRAYTDEQLKEIERAEAETKEFRGKSYTKYQATQVQRRYETAIRQYKDRAAAYEAAAKPLKEANPEAYKKFKDAATAAKGKVTAINQEYYNFSQAMGLYSQPNRASVSSYTRGKSEKTLEKNLEKWYNDSIKIDNGQFGKKIGKHAKEYGLSAGNENDREKMKEIIFEIIKNKDEIRQGLWRGQGEKNESGNKTEGIVEFIIKGDDVVVAKEGEFISILKDGINNPRVKKANRVKE